MVTRPAILTVVLALTALPAVADAARADPSASLLPRELLFGPAAQASPQISPDGRQMAWLAPTKDSDSSIWIGDVGSHPLAGKPLTGSSLRGIYQYLWAEDGTHILYWHDEEGNEKWHLYLVDVATGQTRDLTPYPGARVQNLLLDPRHPHEVLVGINKRDHQTFDAYHIDLDSGATRLDTTNPGDVLSWRADNGFHIRAATAFQATTADTLVRTRDLPEGAWRDLLQWPFNDSEMFGQVNGGSVVAGFTPDDTALYAVSSQSSDKSQLVRVDTRSKHIETVAASDCDVAEDDTGVGVPPDDYRYLILRNPDTGAPQAVAFECTERTWKVLDPSIHADLEFLRSHLDGFPYVLSRSRNGNLWVVANLAGDKPIEYSLYDQRKKSLQPLFSEHPELARYPLAKPQAVTFKARDGLQIPAYLTRPLSQQGPVPLILYPHGGPWARDHMDFDPIVQLLASRGYAVLQVEYRGTTGFGKSFLNASNHEFGLKMRDDLIDGVEWSIAQGIADPKRIAVFGISAGRYLALRVTEARPDLFRATADVVGPSDVKFFLESIPPNWRTVKARWVRRIGDAEHDEALNRKISPHFTSVAAKGAFLVAQGAHDPRVNRKNSDAIVSALRQQGATVSYLVYTDEGHGFVRPENNLDFFGRLEEFLATNLRGRAQPWVQQRTAHVESH